MRAEDIRLTLNRSALVVKPKQPFLDWLHGADSTSADLTLRELALDPAIYLIPECDTVPRHYSKRTGNGAGSIEVNAQQAGGCAMSGI